MPSIEKKNREENLKDKFRSLFSPQDPQKKKNALPPKTHFSIWYILLAFFLFSVLPGLEWVPPIPSGRKT